MNDSQEEIKESKEEYMARVLRECKEVDMLLDKRIKQVQEVRNDMQVSIEENNCIQVRYKKSQDDFLDLI